MPLCKLKIGNYSDDLSAETKNAITNEIMELTSNWVNAHNNMDADKAIELWDSSSDLMFAENGLFFANRDSIYDVLGYLPYEICLLSGWV